MLLNYIHIFDQLFFMFLHCVYAFFRIKDYANHHRELSDVDQSITCDLSELERHLLEMQALMNVRGKVCHQVFSQLCILFDWLFLQLSYSLVILIDGLNGV